MEAIHGVDVSWLHRPTHGQGPTSTAPPQKAPPQKAPPTSQQTIVTATPEKPKIERQVEEAIATAAQSPSKSRRPGILGRPSSEKKSSWMSSLGMKFSSSQAQQPGQVPQSPGAAKSPGAMPATSPAAKSMNSYFPTTGSGNAVKDTSEEAIEEETSPYVPQQPKAGGSFFSSALRRLSTTSQGKPQANIGLGTIGPRKTLNVDQGRDRCTIEELDQSNLRRVSFRVDVELLGGSKYASDSDTPEKKKKHKERKLKERMEGQALKHPTRTKEEKEKDDMAWDGLEAVLSPPSSWSGGSTKTKVDEAVALEHQKSSHKKASKPDPSPEKPSLPAKMATNTNDDSGLGTRKSSSDDTPPPKPDDKPTTDPLRVYRRCCQLREAPVLKRISEQLSNPQIYATENPAVLTCLDLSRSRMQPADIVCLGDWLAIVPVKKLLLEDANLTDESLRVILAGLLAAKHPEVLKRKRGKSNPTQPREMLRQPTGVVERLSLKNNKKITAEGWKYICLFLNMSRSIKAMDVSMIPFPQPISTYPIDQPMRGRGSAGSITQDMADLLRKCLAERLTGVHLEEFLIAECGLSSYQIGRLVDYASTGLPILGLASNHLDQDGLEHIGRYLSSGVCKGLDIGGNDLHDKMDILIKKLEKSNDNPLWALSFANCNLTARDLELLFPALVHLRDFRLLDLSHNRTLFGGSGTTALGVLRRNLPNLPLLKRLNLGDTSLTAPQAIGLAEIIPECRNIAHVSLLDNPELRRVLVEAADVAAREEACAVYASMMTAARLSRTLLCIDIDIPGPSTSEVVKALARQVVAYLLTNIERYSEYDAVKVADAAAALPAISEVEKDAAKPEILQHFLEHHEHPELASGKTPAADEDYFVGGTGVVKALSYCLSASQLRRMSVQPETPTEIMESEAGKATAKEMSRNLLESARKYRSSLQPVLARYVGSPETDILRRLQFLDHTLQGMIERFEHEYPETRLAGTTTPPRQSVAPLDVEAIEAVDPTVSPARSRASSAGSLLSRSDADLGTSPTMSNMGFSPPTTVDWSISTTIDSFSPPVSQNMPLHIGPGSRRGSETQLASRALSMEEARMHRLGQQFRRQILRPTGVTDHLHGVSAADPAESEVAAALRAKLETLGGDELRQKINRLGIEETLRELEQDKEELRRLELAEPEKFRRFREAQIQAERMGVSPPR